MAIRERKGRASPWQCYWNNPFTGKRESESFVTRLEAEKHDSLIKHHIRFDRESFRNEEVNLEEAQEELTLEGVYLLYLREKQFSKNGLSWQMGAMRSALLAFGSKPLADVSTDDLNTLMDNMLATHVKPVTVRNRLSVLRTMLRWAEAKDYCRAIRFPKLPPAHYEHFVPPSQQELADMLTVASPHNQRVIILGAQCGARIGPSELLVLQWHDVDLNAALIRIHGAKKNLDAP